MSENTNTALDLSEAEAAYFESGGETAIPEAGSEPPPEQAKEQPPEQNVEPPPEQVPGERDEKGRFVPHQALHAEREEHKKTKAELERISQQQAILNDRWNTLLKLREEKAPEEAAPPDPDADIFGYAKWQGEQLKKLQEAQTNATKQAEEQRQIQEQEQAIWNEWNQSTTAYAAQKPEFGDAVKWLSDFRTKQLSAMASLDERFATPAGINAQINAELRAIVAGSKQKGLNPAEIVHQMAVSYGFQAPSKAPGDVTMPEKLQNIAAAQEQAKTIGAVPGRAGGDQLTAEAIAAMPPKEFDRWIADPKNASLLDKMMGG